MGMDECTCFRLQMSQLATHCQQPLTGSPLIHSLVPYIKGHLRTPLTVLNDAMLLQCAAQLQSPTAALCLSVLKEPVNQLAARKGAPICNAMLLSQLQDGVLFPYETEETETKTQIRCVMT